jgi:1,4-dihydroxy-2-naphthoate octaprenyltransferase
MRSDKSKELAEHILGYSVAKCFEHHHDWISVLTALQRLIQIQINLNEVNDPDRNK